MIEAAAKAKAASKELSTEALAHALRIYCVGAAGAEAGADGWLICLAEARALWWGVRDLCRILLLCVPDGVAAGVALAPAAGAAGAVDWSVWATAARGERAKPAPRAIATILFSIVFSQK
jgi:hypothetical protein